MVDENFGEMENLIFTYGLSSFIPPRIIDSFYYHTRLLRKEIFDEYKYNENIRNYISTLIYILGKLHAESDIIGMTSYLELRRIFKTGEFYQLLASFKETGLLLFYLSLNIETLKNEVLLGNYELSFIDLIKDIEQIIKLLKSSNAWNEYSSLHTVRAIAELSRLTYSLKSEIKGKLNDICGCSLDNGQPDEEPHWCIIKKARKIIEDAHDKGWEKTKLAYIQVTSTTTRTNIMILEGHKETEKGMEDAKKVLDSLDLETALKLDALPLYGSYHYNWGWYLAWPKPSENFTITKLLNIDYSANYRKAAKEFWKAAKKFIKVRINNNDIILGYVRGAYVSLWNYYLMNFSASLLENYHKSHSFEIKEEDLKLVIPWAKMFIDAFKNRSNPIYYALIIRAGVHGWHSVLLGILSDLMLYGQFGVVNEVLDRESCDLYKEMPSNHISRIFLIASNIENSYSKKLQDMIKNCRSNIMEEIAKNNKLYIYSNFFNNMNRISEVLIKKLEDKSTVREYPILASIKYNLNENNKDRLKNIKKLVLLHLVFTT